MFADELDGYFEALSALAPAGFAAGLRVRFSGPTIMRQTYPEEWTKIYTENQMGFVDPIVLWGLSHTGWIRWSSISIPDLKKIFKKGKEYGLHFGIAVATGPLHERSILGVARADREFTDSEAERIVGIFDKLHHLATDRKELTKAQIEALRCIADGLKHDAAAYKLGISPSALKARLTAARRTLGARTVSEAISRAKEQNTLN